MCKYVYSHIYTYVYIYIYIYIAHTYVSWSRCLACSWTTEVEAGQFASDGDAVTNLLCNALG